VYKYSNDLYTTTGTGIPKRFIQGAGYKYFLSTLQYCVDTCTSKQLSEWVAVLYSNSTCAYWLSTVYDFNSFPYECEYYRRPKHSVKYASLNTHFIFGFPYFSWGKKIKYPAVQEVLGNLIGLPNFHPCCADNYAAVLKHTAIEEKELLLLERERIHPAVQEDRIKRYGYFKQPWIQACAICPKRRFLKEESTTCENKRRRIGYIRSIGTY